MHIFRTMRNSDVRREGCRENYDALQVMVNEVSLTIPPVTSVNRAGASKSPAFISKIRRKFVRGHARPRRELGLNRAPSPTCTGAGMPPATHPNLPRAHSLAIIRMTDGVNAAQKIR